MLFKLSISGLKSKLIDYTVLLVGLIMSISIFYMFQTLALNRAFLETNGDIDSIQYVFHTGSFLLAIITFFYIFYANSFLLALRKKEFGMYMTLGAKKHKVMLLMFMETIIIGATSLVIGISVGVGLAQGIGQLLMKQLDMTASGYHSLYLPSIAVTCLFFVVLFICSALLNTVKLSRTPALKLVHGETNADSVMIKGRWTGVVAFLSLIFLTIGYSAMFNLDKLKESGIMIAMLFTTTGTYLCFESLLPYLIKKLKGNKKRKEKGLNAFTFAQLNFRINGLTKVLATVAMLIALGAGAISGGMTIKNNVMKSTDQVEIYDTIIYNPTTEETEILHGISFDEENEYRYKVDDSYVYFGKENLEKNPLLIYKEKEEWGFSNELKHVSELLPVGAISQDSQETNKTTKIIPDEWDTALRSIMPTYLDFFDKPIKIVNQSMFKELQAKEGVVFIGKTNDFKAYLKEWKKLDELQLMKYKDVKSEDMFSKYKLYNGINSVSSGTIFMGFFLGIAFLAMMASCLMFKILSGASIDIKRYEMLRKLGVRRELLTKSIYKELFLIFLFPSIIGIVHVLIGMNLFGYMVIDPYFRIWLPIIIFLIIYTIYYLITVKLYKGIVLPKKI